MTYRFSAVELARALGDPHPPTAQQIEAIEASTEPRLIIAGAGSGKTATMASRVVWLVANGFARGDQILGLTFTKKAAGELSARIRRRLARLSSLGSEFDDVGEPMVSTYHSYASSVVSEHGMRAGIEPGATVLSQAQVWQLAYSVVRDWDGPMSDNNFEIKTIVERLLSLSDELSEHLRDASHVTDFTSEFLSDIARRLSSSNAAVKTVQSVARARVQLLPLVHAYAEKKRNAGAVDFADMLYQAAVLTRDFDDVGRIERDRYRFVLLDEYQDTSVAQVELLRSLYGNGHPVTAVGDPCQSIYGWRGASAGTLGRFIDEFRTKDDEPASRSELTISWRNTAPILSVANAVSEPLRENGFDVPALEPGVQGSGEVACTLHLTVNDEAEWIARQISTLWNQALEEGAAPPSTAVLVRAKKQISLIEQALKAVDVPVVVVGGGGLLDVPEVREIYTILRVIARPSAGADLLRLLTGPRWRIGARDLVALHERARELLPQQRGFEPDADGLSDVTLSEALDDLGDLERYSPHGAQRFTALRQELAQLRSRASQPIDDLITEIIELTGLAIEIAVGGKDQTRLDAFLNEAHAYQTKSPTPSLDGFLWYLEAAEENDRGLELSGVSERHDAVQILTIHSAKGLEWDAVVVPGLVDGTFPGRQQGVNWVTAPGKLPFPLRGDALELPSLQLGEASKAAELSKAFDHFKADVTNHFALEERRLAYVAFTRARSLLLASGYCWNTTEKPVKVSDFLEEARIASGIKQFDVTPGDSNPLKDVVEAATWPPVAPLGQRQEATESAATAVLAAFDGSDQNEYASVEGRSWADEANLLLAEQEEQARGLIDIAVPETLSVSALVAWHQNESEYAMNLRRPVPREPEPYTRRGTAFHAWVEQRLGGSTLFDLDDLPGAADPDVDTDDELNAMMEAFEASVWADQVPVAVEVPFVTVLSGVIVRGRMDAVFRTENGYEVVDWKTGRPPTGHAAKAASIQLAAYRQAWAGLQGIAVTKVTAAFHYVRDNVTVRPSDLLDLDELAEPLATDSSLLSLGLCHVHAADAVLVVDRSSIS